MTEAEIRKAEREAKADAESLGLLLLLALTKRDARGLAAVTFDRQRARFIINGRAVSLRSIRAYLVGTERRLAGRILKQLNELEAGRITEAEWKRSFESSIRSSHILAGALALGGIAAASRNPYVIDRIESELSYAADFAAAIRANDAGSIRKIKARAAQYFRAAHITFVNAQYELIKETGFYKECRNRMRPAEHCRRDVRTSPSIRIDCPTLSSGSWVELDRMVPVGQRICRLNCRCYLEYR